MKAYKILIYNLITQRIGDLVGGEIVGVQRWHQHPIGCVVMVLDLDPDRLYPTASKVDAKLGLGLFVTEHSDGCAQVCVLLCHRVFAERSRPRDAGFHQRSIAASRHQEEHGSDENDRCWPGTPVGPHG